MYFKKYGKNNPDAPSVMIVLDSIDMLLTDKENDDFESGIQKGDQGQIQVLHIWRCHADHLISTDASTFALLPFANWNPEDGGWLNARPNLVFLLPGWTHEALLIVIE